jgi:hypothetical protein
MDSLGMMLVSIVFSTMVKRMQKANLNDWQASPRQARMPQ